MAEEERKAVSGFFLQYFWVAAGEWNMLHLCINGYIRSSSGAEDLGAEKRHKKNS